MRVITPRQRYAKTNRDDKANSHNNALFKKNLWHTEIVNSQSIIGLLELFQSKTPFTAFGFRALGGPGVLGGGFAPMLYPTLNC